MTGVKQPRFFYGYVVAASCFIIQGIGIGTLIAFGVFFKPLIAEFGWSRAMISGAASVSQLTMGLFGVAVGRLNDRVGPRLIMTGTGLVLGLGYFLMSRLGTAWQLYVFYGLVLGLGFSSLDVVALSTTARWFIRRRGLMTGVVKVGTGAGQLVMPLLAAALIITQGWRSAFSFIAILIMVLIVIVAQFLRRDPGKMGLRPDGKEWPGNSALDTKDTGFSFREAIGTRQLWIICLINLIVVFCAVTIMVHIVAHATDLGIPPASAATVLAAIGGVSMAGRLLTGFAIDRMGNKKTMVVCFLLLITGLTWLLVARDLWALYLFALVYGLAHGGLFTLISPVVAEHFGMTSHGVLLGLAVFSGTIGGAIGPFLAGYLFDRMSSYQTAFVLLVVLGIAGLFLAAVLRPIRPEQASQTAKA